MATQLISLGLGGFHLVLLLLALEYLMCCGKWRKNSEEVQDNFPPFPTVSGDSSVHISIHAFIDHICGTRYGSKYRNSSNGHNRAPASIRLWF